MKNDSSSQNPPAHAFFAPCPRGLEALLAVELEHIGASDVAVAPGGVSFTGNMKTCWRANLESRLASRVLMRLAHVPYRTEQDIYDTTCGINWPSRFNADQSLRVDVNAIRCPLKSLEFVTLRIKDAVCDRFRATVNRRPDVDTRNPDVRIQGFLNATHFTLYLDTSGEPLYKRGWRSDAGEAPLKENLAAGMVLLSGWDGVEPFYDPMCGSGTLLIEAAMIALAIPPGSRRSFGFEKLTGHDVPGWTEVRSSVMARAGSVHPLEIYGSDQSDREIRRTRDNLGAAGLAGVAIVATADILQTTAPASQGVMVTNPPYGVRLGNASDLAAFYPMLGNALKARFSGWRCYFLSADPDLPKLIRLKATRRTPLFNGPLECRLYEYRMQEGSLRREKPAPGNSS